MFPNLRWANFWRKLWPRAALILACVATELHAPLGRLWQVPAGAGVGQPDASGGGTILTWPLPKLIKAFRELHGLEPAASQGELPSLLGKVGEYINTFSEHLPNMVAQEDIVLHQLRGARQFPATDNQRYDYFVLAHRMNGEVRLDEYRALPKDSHGGLDPIPYGFVLTQGFAEMWVVFSPRDRGKPDFRYLGRQLIRSQWTYVIAFAARPGEVGALTGTFGAGPTSVSLQYQGIAWFSADDFHPVQLRAELLAPHPEIKLSRITTEITFGEVRLPTVSAPL